MKIKICGLKTPDTVTTAIESGADFIGFVFHAPSPRNIDPETARYLRRYVPAHISALALLVDPCDKTLDDIMTAVQPDMIQLHGNETPERVAAIKTRSKIPAMKAIRVTGAASLDAIKEYEAVSDWLLFDSGPGGSGKSFDWTILAGRSFTKPWMLSGGLDAANIGEALALLRPDAVDVSSGVESAPGTKDPAKIREFIAAARL
ncbi:MAG: phosphoribosylanthranilate isomerase [Alphaproteobacteria bacterium]